MSDISRVALFVKLNNVGYKAIEGATVFCKLRGNPYVEVVHWLHQILQLQNSDLHCIVRAFSLDPGKLARDITETLDRLPRGATSISDLSPHIEDSVERAWVWATLKYGDTQVRTGYLVVAMLKTPSLKNLLSGISREFEKVKPDQLAEDYEKICAGSPEASLSASDGTHFGGQAAPGEDTGAIATTYTLPAAEAGMTVCARMSYGNAQVLRIDTDGSDYIVMSTGARTSAAGDYYGATSEDKNQVCVVAFNDSDWYVTSEVGTWTEE